MKKNTIEIQKGKIIIMIIEEIKNEEETQIDLIHMIQVSQAHLIEGVETGKREKIREVLIMGLIILIIQNNQIMNKIILKIIQISDILYDYI